MLQEKHSTFSPWKWIGTSRRRFSSGEGSGKKKKTDIITIKWLIKKGTFLSSFFCDLTAWSYRPGSRPLQDLKTLLCGKTKTIDFLGAPKGRGDRAAPNPGSPFKRKMNDAKFAGFIDEIFLSMLYITRKGWFRKKPLRGKGKRI